jgi:hypothetical protein
MITCQILRKLESGWDGFLSPLRLISRRPNWRLLVACALLLLVLAYHQGWF